MMGPNPLKKLNCDALASDVRKIKSVGKFGGAIRAVETAVAAGGSGITGGCTLSTASSGSQIMVRWGNGCKSVGTVLSSANCENAADATHECGIVSTVGALAQPVCLCIEK